MNLRAVTTFQRTINKDQKHNISFGRIDNKSKESLSFNNYQKIKKANLFVKNKNLSFKGKSFTPLGKKLIQKGSEVIERILTKKSLGRRVSKKSDDLLSITRKETSKPLSKPAITGNSDWNHYDDNTIKLMGKMKKNGVDTYNIDRSTYGGMTSVDKSIKESEIREKISAGKIDPYDGQQMIDDLSFCGEKHTEVLKDLSENAGAIDALSTKADITEAVDKLSNAAEKKGFFADLVDTIVDFFS